MRSLLQTLYLALRQCKSTLIQCKSLCALAQNIYNATKQCKSVLRQCKSKHRHCTSRFTVAQTLYSALIQCKWALRQCKSTVRQCKWKLTLAKKLNDAQKQCNSMCIVTKKNMYLVISIRFSFLPVPNGRYFKEIPASFSTGPQRTLKSIYYSCRGKVKK